MSTPSKIRGRRDIAFVFGVTLLAFLPIGFIWYKNRISPPLQTDNPQTGQPTPALTPVIPQAYGGQNPMLSPDGHWIARLEQSPPPTPNPAGYTYYSPSADQLVVYSTATGKEIYRDIGIDEIYGWIPQSNNLITYSNDNIVLYTPTVRTGNSSQTPPWTPKIIDLPPLNPSSKPTVSPTRVSPTRVGSNPRTPTPSYMGGGLYISPDMRYLVEAHWQQGQIWWRVLNLATSKVSPPIMAGRVLNSDPNQPGYSYSISFAVAPIGVGKGPLPMVTVMQCSDIVPRVNPLATPTQVANSSASTPGPTPTYSPAQAQFLKKKLQEEKEIQKIIDKIHRSNNPANNAANTSPTPAMSDEELSYLTAEVRRRYKALDDEKARVFPLYGQEKARLAASPYPSASLSQTLTLNDKLHFQIEAIDLNTRKSLWTTHFLGARDIPNAGGRTLRPIMQFSPDGSGLVALNTATIVNSSTGATLQGGGLEFFDPLTGKHRGSSQLCWAANHLTQPFSRLFYYDQAAFNADKSRTIFAVTDSYPDFQYDASTHHRSPVESTVLRFFDIAQGREIGHLNCTPLVASKMAGRALSCDQFGNNWLLGSDAILLKRSELGEDLPTPFATPTPLPATTAASTR